MFSGLRSVCTMPHRCRTKDFSDFACHQSLVGNPVPRRASTDSAHLRPGLYGLTGNRRNELVPYALDVRPRHGSLSALAEKVKDRKPEKFKNHTDMVSEDKVVRQVDTSASRPEGDGLVRTVGRGTHGKVIESLDGTD